MKAWRPNTLLGEMLEVVQDTSNEEETKAEKDTHNREEDDEDARQLRSTMTDKVKLTKAREDAKRKANEEQTSPPKESMTGERVSIASIGNQGTLQRRNNRS
ncbi:hypothetical protein GOP47_0010691 [Adiantum capillus-veneris]|uniref:Uncharacterized protein n=1 Tax=Adiantum capillus-veneris TaxID=13818 RepID=A0A9D4UV08_ADICA|nr:hypothetical protein GOP47_0010691 [Adiantum capillus-veneris]